MPWEVFHEIHNLFLPCDVTDKNYSNMFLSCIFIDNHVDKCITLFISKTMLCWTDIIIQNILHTQAVCEEYSTKYCQSCGTMFRFWIMSSGRHNLCRLMIKLCLNLVKSDQNRALHQMRFFMGPSELTHLAWNLLWLLYGFIFF